MGSKEDEFLQRLLAAFKVEANEHIKAVTTGLLDLERMPAGEDCKDIVEVIFREMHSLKGAARSVNLTDIETICQSLEDIFASLKRGKPALAPTLFDLLHCAMDLIDLCLRSPEGVDPGHVVDMVRRLEFAQGEARERQGKGKTERREHGDTATGGTGDARTCGCEDTEIGMSARLPVSESPHLRVTTSRLDSLFLGSEEMLSAKLMAGQHVSELRRLKAMIELWQKRWSRIYPEIRSARLARERKNDGGREEKDYVGRNDRDKSLLQSVELLEFLDWTQEHLASFEKGITDLTRCAENDYRSISSMVDTLLGGMKSVMMLPFSTLLEVFPKMVRDLAHAQSKELRLLISGDKVEVHKRVLELLKDPLIHLIRNCIDHGIEKPEARERNGKPPCGSITIAVSQISGHSAEVIVSDNGAGIDVERVKKAAIKRGALPEVEARGLAEKEALALVFHSEVSTSPIISDLSGRGLGLAIAREKVEELGGAISVESAPGVGTSFRIRFPVTVATFRGVLARVEEQVFVIPTLLVERTLGIEKSRIRTIGNKDTIALNGETLSLIRLGDVLKIPRREKKGNSPGTIDALLLDAGHKRIAFSVDEVIGEQEVLIKSLGRQLSRVRTIAGATVLGSGKLVLVLHVRDLMKYADIAGSGSTAAQSDDSSVERFVLIVEDSITSRILLKNILETAGYRVKTAVDGVEALTALKTEPFDLVVSDVDMPRMNGYELTTRIRGDGRLADLPVVLVTALGSREDRERGIDVGANAYIVKSSFDQSNLLEVVRRFIGVRKDAAS